jgi:hypothetical protein
MRHVALFGNGLLALSRPLLELCELFIELSDHFPYLQKGRQDTDLLNHPSIPLPVLMSD